MCSRRLLLCIVPLLILSQCSKDNQEMLMEEIKLAENASLNLEINKLRDSLKDATTDFDRAVIYAKIANINAEKGNVTEAIKTSQESIKYQPNQYLSHYLLGKAYLQAGRYADAESELAVSIELKNTFALSHFELGNVYYKIRQFAKAEKEFKSALGLDNTLFMAHNNLGVIKSLQGRHADAVKSLEAAAQANANFATAYKNLGIIYDSKLNNKALAIKNYRKYIELSPNCPERQQILMWIRALGG